MPERSIDLQTLLRRLPGASLLGPSTQTIRGVAYDSRQVRPGVLFAAIRGFAQDGHAFVADAVSRGAVGVLVEQTQKVPSGVSQIVVPDSRLALARAAAAFYGDPSRAMTVIGVTGTNGKGVTTYFLDAILTRAGHRSAVIGTMGVKSPAGTIETSRTTPESVDLQRLLADLRAEGVTHVGMEVASHALALHRVAETRFAAAVFTNLTQDHLDFHGTFEAYRAAKRRLFEMVEPDGWSVINAADDAAQEMSEASRAPVWFYSMDGRPPAFFDEHRVDVVARDVSLGLQGTTFTVVAPDGTAPVRLHIGGAFNVENALAALTTGLAMGIPLDVGAPALEAVRGVPGRFEPVDEGQDFAVVVDYAHTPDGLENVLRTARQIVQNRLLVVFGCGGDRDRTKRPIMGRLAVELADFAIVTSDNPRTEQPRAIIEEILQGMKDAPAQGRYEVEPERRQAIQRAIEMARSGDVVVIAGKGHEPYQEIHGVKHPFDDREVAREALRGQRSAAR